MKRWMVTGAAVAGVIAAWVFVLSPAGGPGQTVGETGDRTTRFAERVIRDVTGIFRAGTAAPPEDRVPIQDCDRLAQPPRADMPAGAALTDGVPPERIDVSAARAACAAARAAYPHTPRFLAFAGRVEGRASQDAEAARLYRRATEQGYAVAQHSLGLMYMQGRGVTHDIAEAARLYRLAAEQGYAPAQSSLAYMYNGRGATLNYAEAVRLYRLAAEQGYARAQSGLAFMYMQGLGVTRDITEAARLYRLAADQGDVGGQYFLGDMYRDGRGVPRDAAEAVRLYRLAANQGDAGAQHNLGDMYETGRGVPRDDAEAIRLYRLAAARGHQPAIDALQRLGLR
jgi:TPR repeat protein